jgi:hypothetical protein
MIDTELTTNWIWLNAEIETTYKTEVREEECHGTHIFLDSEVLSEDVIRVVIKTKECDIDITSRLTQKELELLKIPFVAEID